MNFVMRAIICDRFALGMRTLSYLVALSEHVLHKKAKFYLTFCDRSLALLSKISGQLGQMM